MPDAEITVQYLGTNKKNPTFGFIKSAEGTNYGCKAEQLKQFSTGQIYTIRYHTNQRGYAEFDAIISAPPVKQNVRPATNPADSDRMAVMGMVNNFIACGQVARDPDAVAEIIQICHDGLMRSVIKGKQTQRRDDLNDEIQF